MKCQAINPKKKTKPMLILDFNALSLAWGDTLLPSRERRLASTSKERNASSKVGLQSSKLSAPATQVIFTEPMPTKKM
jgi:hypothetical protein